MENEAKKIVELYNKANSNKEEIVLYNEDGRDFSRAEMTVLACLAIVAREAEYSKMPALPKEVDYDEVIKILIINSLDGKISGLKKEKEYSNLIESYKNMEMGPAYGANIVYRGMIDNFNPILDPVYKEEVFVFENLRLRELIRKEHIYWGCKAERLESILEHIYGCLVLAVGIESEYSYSIDYKKLFKMLLLHETGEIKIGDLTEWDISKEEKSKKEREGVVEILSKLYGGDSLINLLDEFNLGSTLESEYANLIDKLEYDMQVKVYDDNNMYDFESYPRNVVTESNRVQDIISRGAQSVFDVHYENDKSRYSKLPCMRRILEETKQFNFIQDSDKLCSTTKTFVPKLKK